MGAWSLHSVTRFWLRASALASVRQKAHYVCAAALDEVPRVDASTLQPGDLIQQVTRPVILTNLAEGWPAAQMWNLDYLATVHGDKKVALLKLPEDLFKKDEVTAAYGNSLYADHVRNAYVPFVRMPRHLTLKEYIKDDFCDYIFDIGDNSLARRLCVDAFGGLDRMPEILAADDLTQLTFGMGPAEDGVMFHSHTAAWNALMFGEKEWFFYPPDGFVGEPYERYGMLGATALPEATGLRGGGDGANPKPMRVLQRPGEVIFVPDGWWHATFSHTDTACLGGQRHKDRLPADWAETLLRRWPGSGLFLNAVAKERNDHSLFEAAIATEPWNLRFSVEYMSFLRDRGEFTKAVRIGKDLRSAMDKARRKGNLGRAEFAAVLAQLGEILFETVEVASAVVSKKMKSQPKAGGDAMAGFKEVIQVSVVAREFIDEALEMDRGCPLARALVKAIDKKSKKADFSKLPPGFGKELKLSSA